MVEPAILDLEERAVRCGGSEEGGACMPAVSCGRGLALQSELASAVARGAAREALAAAGSAMATLRRCERACVPVSASGDAFTRCRAVAAGARAQLRRGGVGDAQPF